MGCSDGPDASRPQSNSDASSGAEDATGNVGDTEASDGGTSDAEAVDGTASDGATSDGTTQMDGTADTADGMSGDPCVYQGKSDGVCGNATLDPNADGEICQEPDNYEDDESTCDEVDNDCDGVVDEGCKCDALNRDRGVCTEGTVSDSDGSCEPPESWQREETKCDGKDNDCDGVVDEGCKCDYNGEDRGVCTNGQKDDDGNCQAPGDYQSDETACDAKDNDCDGETDEGCTCQDGTTEDCYTGPSGTAGRGECERGERTCNGGDFGSCMNEVTPEPEKCNGLDDDCDGTVDEGCSCQDGETQSCYTGPQGTKGVGPCTGGIQTCQNGSFGTCNNEVTPEDEACSSDGSGNNTDEDCDGTKDEGCQCNYDNTSTGVCSDGTIGSNGSCQPPGDYQQDETLCDGLDNDCDGITDEGCDCDYNGTSTGVCSNGTLDSNGNCQAPATYDNTEKSCGDGLDNDCDGSTDCLDDDCDNVSCGGGPNICCPATSSCQPANTCP